MFEREWRESSFITRFNIARVLRRQNIAEHTYYVTVYALQLADMLGYGEDETKLAMVRKILVHDRPENATGDLPSPFKQNLSHEARDQIRVVEDAYDLTRFPETHWWHGHDLPRSALDIIKIADILEAIFYCCTEIQMGNMSLGTLCPSDFKEVESGKRGKIGKGGVIQYLLAHLAEAWFTFDLDFQTRRHFWDRTLIPAILNHTHDLSNIITDNEVVLP